MGRTPARLAAALLLLAAALLAPAAAAPSTPAGPVLAVSPQDGFFLAPDVAVDPAGNVVVVWYGEAAGQSTAEVEVYARRFGPSGAPLGPAFRVNAATAGQQRRPAVAIDPTGAFVVAWDTGTSTIWARRFGPDGAPRSGDIAVSQSAAANRDPDVAVAADGAFVVAWQLTPPAGDDDVAVRAFDPDGAPLGPERIPFSSAAESAFQMNPALAALPGASALVWEEERAGSTAIVLQRLDPAGVPAGPLQPVAQSSTDELRDAAVAAAPDGAAVVAWATFTPASGGIAARSYAASGAPLGPAVPVAPPEAVERFLPSVAVAADGSAVVAWVDEGTLLDAPIGVAARKLTAAGQPDGDLFYPRPPAPGETAPTGLAAAVSPAPEGVLWVAWAQSPPGAGETTSAIAMRRVVERLYTLGLPLLSR